FHRLVHVLPRRTGTDLGLLRSAHHVSVFPASRYSSRTNCSFCIARRVLCALLAHPLLFRIISHSTIYSGVFSHSTLNWVPPARIQQLVHNGPFTIAQRLLVNKSPILTTVHF